MCAYSPQSWWSNFKSPADRSMAARLFSLQNFSFHYVIVSIPATCLKNLCYLMPSRQCGVPPFCACMYEYVTSQFTYARPSAVWPWWHWIGWSSSNTLRLGGAIAQVVVAGFPPRRPGFDPGSGQVGFVVDKVALGQVFSEYFGFPCKSSFQQLLHNHPHLSSGAGTIGQKRPQYKGLSPTPPAIKKKHYTSIWKVLSLNLSWGTMFLSRSLWFSSVSTGMCW
jgi:hypothetical protein